MSKSLLIARRELSSFFSTWTGYIIIAVALIIEGLLFNAFAIGSTPKYSADVLADFFYFASGISIVAGLFLAMRLVAEEKQTGTIVLFNTSPITERQLIYGKFISAVLFTVIFLLMTMYMPALIFVNGKVSLGHLSSGYLMLLLIGASAIAITLFASTIAPNQLIAGILGAFLIVSFLVLWIVSDVVDDPFKKLFTYLALHNMHFNPFAKGIVHTRDIIYYFSVSFFFLECSVRALEARRWRG
ncbi:MAG: ABC transporter permease subunit [Bdellovibrionota bacterium]